MIMRQDWYKIRKKSSLFSPRPHMPPPLRLLLSDRCGWVGPHRESSGRAPPKLWSPALRSGCKGLSMLTGAPDFAPGEATISNIARGTTDPGNWVFNLNYLVDRVEYVSILDNSNFRQMPGSVVLCATPWVGCKFGHQMMLFALITNLATRWRNTHQLQFWPRWCHLHKLKIGQTSGTTWILSKFGHQVTPHALVPKFAIRWQHLQILRIWPPGCVTCIVTLPWIALVALSSSIELVSTSTRVTSVKFQKGRVSLTH